MNGRTVLIAEDEEFNLIPIKDRLKEEGYKVIVADDPERLINLAPSADILIVDGRLSLQVQDDKGVAAVVTLCARGELSPSVPVIFLSGFDENDPMFKDSLDALRKMNRPYFWRKRLFLELDVIVEMLENLLNTEHAERAKGGG
jgi:CheY-like chemotaxis protein